MNYLKTFTLLAALTLLLIWIGGVIGGARGAMFAFVFSLIINFGSYWFSDKIVLAIYRAQPVSESQAPELHRIVRSISQSARLPMPHIFIIPQKGANAFATGRNPQNAVVAVTEGILNLLNEEELKGVLAHEMAHVKNRDILICSIAATIAGAVMMLANMARWVAIFGGYSNSRERGGSNIFGLIIIAIVAPIAALIIRMAVSRSREYLADEVGAKFIHSGFPLASALKKLELQASRRPVFSNAQSSHLFIVNPLRSGSFINLFSTHPPIEKRIERLEHLNF